MKIKLAKSQIIFILTVFVVLIGVFVGFFLINNPMKKVYHVGIISGTDFFAGTDQGFIQKMRELGYKEGENIIYDIQKTNNDSEAANKIIKKFIDDKVDLIFAFPTNVAIQAKELAKNTKIPVVFGDATIEGSGLVKDVNYPGDNITGVRQETTETVVKRFELMHKLAPNAKRYLIFYQADIAIVPNQIRELVSLAQESDVELVLKPVKSTADIVVYLKEQEESLSLDFDAILTIIEPIANIPVNSQVLSVFANMHNIPFGGAPLSGEYENLFGVSMDTSLAGGQAAILADKVLKGTFAGSIPVVTAEKYIQINLKIARRLGLTVDNNLFSQADEIIR